MLTNLKMKRDQVEYRVSEQIEFQVRDQIQNQANIQVYRAWAWPQVRNQVWNQAYVQLRTPAPSLTLFL